MKSYIKRTCKCCDGDFEAPPGVSMKYVLRCYYCRMNCGRQGRCAE